MRTLILLLSLLAPAFAFSLSCPSNGSPLKDHDSIQEVVERCGQAISSYSYTNTTIISSEWEYYITNLYNNTNTKLKILFDRGQIANISIIMSGENEQNVKSSGICRMLIQVGNNMSYVQSVCGNPMSKKTLQTTSTQITELKYNGISPNTLIFENGNLTNWK